MRHGCLRLQVSALLAFFVASPPLLAEGTRDVATPRVSYTLEARLVPTAARGFDILGRGTVSLVNDTPAALTDLPLHLYMNAFRDEHSLAARSPFFDGRAAQQGSRGSIDVTRFVDERNGQTLAVVTPAEGEDRTTAQVSLRQPIPPGAEATFGVEWTVHLPRVSQRTGYAEDFVFAGQWFPKLAKLEADGTWVQFAYHPQAEFYANFGDYDVTLHVPAGYRVGASGAEMSDDGQPDGVGTRYLARDVHDFAWSAWPAFQRYQESIGGTEVIALTPPGQERNRELTLETLRRALPWLNAWLGPYPYPTLTVVHPPTFAEGAGGMEYPGLITTGGAVWEGYFGDAVERVVAHELAHQWFYGMLASNEYASPFLDEGLTAYAEDRILHGLFTSRTDVALERWANWQRRFWSNRYGRDVALASPAPAFPSFSHLSALPYDRTALLLETFRRLDAGFDRTIAQYVERFRWKHPTPQDFIATVGELSGERTEENLRKGLFERATVDFRVVELSSAKTLAGVGYDNRILVTRQGALQFPVEIDVWTDGSRQRHFWDGTGEFFELELKTSAPVAAVCVDVEEKIAIEGDRRDNCTRRTPPAVTRYWTLLLGWIEVALGAWCW